MNSHLSGKAPPSAGFTLTELLVALVLVGLATMLVAGALGIGVRSWQGTERVSDRIRAIVAAQTFLRRQIANAYPRVVGEPGDRSVAFLGGDRELTFVSALPEHLTGGGFQRLRLYIEDRNGTLVIAWQTLRDPAAAVDARRPGREETEPLLRGIEGLRLRYYGAVPETARPRWHDRWVGQLALPMLVEITLLGDETAAVSWPPLVVRPQIAADARCRFDPVDRSCRL